MTGPSSRTGVYRVDWIPGTDRLVGSCFCGAVHDADDPVEIWRWLLGHPEGHSAPAGTGPGAAGAPALLASV